MIWIMSYYIMINYESLVSHMEVVAVLWDWLHCSHSFCAFPGCTGDAAPTMILLDADFPSDEPVGDLGLLDPHWIIEGIVGGS